MKQNIIPPIPKSANGWSRIIIWILTTIASVSVAYGVLTTKIDNIEKEMVETKTEINLLKSINNDIIVLKTTMEYIKDQVIEIKSVLKEIHRKIN